MVSGRTTTFRPLPSYERQMVSRDYFFMADLILSKRVRHLRRRGLPGGVIAALRAPAVPRWIQPGKGGVTLKLLHVVPRDR